MQTQEPISMTEFRELKTLVVKLILLLILVFIAMSGAFFALYSNSMQIQEARFTRIDKNTTRILTKLNREKSTVQQKSDPNKQISTPPASDFESPHKSNN